MRSWNNSNINIVHLFLLVLHHVRMYSYDTSTCPPRSDALQEKSTMSMNSMYFEFILCSLNISWFYEDFPIFNFKDDVPTKNAYKIQNVPFSIYRVNCARLENLMILDYYLDYNNSNENAGLQHHQNIQRIFNLQFHNHRHTDHIAISMAPSRRRDEESNELMKKNSDQGCSLQKKFWNLSTRVATQSQIHIGADSKNTIFALFRPESPSN